jgi:hypothetical protein
VAFAPREDVDERRGEAPRLERFSTFILTSMASRLITEPTRGQPYNYTAVGHLRPANRTSKEPRLQWPSEALDEGRLIPGGLRQSGDQISETAKAWRQLNQFDHPGHGRIAIQI